MLNVGMADNFQEMESNTTRFAKRVGHVASPGS